MTGAQVLHAEPGHIGRDGLDVIRPASDQRLRRGRGNGKGHVLELLLAQHRRDRDRLERYGLHHQVERDRRPGRDLNVLGHGPQAGQ